MAKKSKEVVEETVETPVVKETKKLEYPVVVGTKKFQSVAFQDGYVVYNPSGDRASGVLTQEKANDIVRSMNQHAHLK